MALRTGLGGWSLAAAMCAALLTPAAARAEFDTYTVDPAHFSIGFMTHHLGYEQVLGMFLKGTGSFEYDADAPAVRNIDFTVEADSVFTNDQARDGHLRSDAFLDAETHPTIRFVADTAERTGEATGIVHGDLTIRGETRPATFEFMLNKEADYPFGAGPPHVVGVSVRGMVTRSEFGSTYAVDNGWVGDEINVMIEFEAIRQD